MYTYFSEWSLIDSFVKLIQCFERKRRIFGNKWLDTALINYKKIKI